jgi:DnaJ domain
MSKLDRFHGRIDEAQRRICDWPGCAEAGAFRAPTGHEGSAPGHIFCLDHVREYNSGWDYFKGLDPQEIEQLQHQSYSWDRPTWPIGENGHGRTSAPIFGPTSDPHEFFDEAFDHTRTSNGQGRNGAGSGAKGGARSDSKRPGANIRKALHTLGLGTSASAAQIKSSYKKLVKKYHPDTNKGEPDAPKLLQRVIEAYNQLSGSLKNR